MLARLPDRRNSRVASAVNLRSGQVDWRLFYLRFFSWRQFNFASWTVLDPNRRADKAERLANLVIEKAFVGEVQLHVLVSKENERGRTHVGLRHVEDFHLLAIGHRGTIKIHAINELVDL